MCIIYCSANESVVSRAHGMCKCQIPQRSTLTLGAKAALKTCMNHEQHNDAASVLLFRCPLVSPDHWSSLASVCEHLPKAFRICAVLECCSAALTSMHFLHCLYGDALCMGILLAVKCPVTECTVSLTPFARS